MQRFNLALMRDDMKHHTQLVATHIRKNPMSFFHLYTSNRLEHLALILASVLGVPQDPMRSQTIVVQSRGMQRWITMQLAQEHGIVANVRFPFPVHFAHHLCSRLVGNVPEDYTLSQQRLVWRIVQAMPQLLPLPEFTPVATYLRGASDLKLVQFAQRMAYLFDLYVQFRPNWAQCWEQGHPCPDLHRQEHRAAEAWQARLWQHIVTGHEHEHRAALLQRTLEALAQNVPVGILPEQIVIFGISTLPPAYLDLVLTVAHHVPVHMFLLSPCRHYWGDLTAQYEQRQDYRRFVRTGIASLHTEDRLPLANLGPLGRDFHEALVERGVDELPAYQPISSPGSLLQWIQKDILEAGQLELDAQALAQGTISLKNCQSVQIHCCHSPLREMEVLRDLLLDLLQHDPTLEPGDILVLNPTLENYAPFIHAVFGTSENPRHALPYAIADNNPSNTNITVQFFLELLSIGQHRFEASWVCALLESQPLRELLDIQDHDCVQIADWVREAGICWGTDSAFRVAHGLPATDQNTWRSGMERLFLGYMTGSRLEPVLGVAPIGPVSSSDQDLLGRVAECIERLHHLWEELRTPATALVWQERLLNMITHFFPHTGALAEGVLTLRQGIMSLIEDINASNLDTELDTAGITHVLRSRLDDASSESGFLSAGLTFCGMRPMRAIPFRVICLTGLSSTAFPRQDPHLGFDLLAAAPLRGDRSQREDDRYLFLENLISVREYLILTYPGLSPEDNSQSPPSVLVSELLDYLDSRFSLDGQPPSKRIVTKHRLQAFHPDYFTAESGLFSYCAHTCAGAQALVHQEHARAVFLPESEYTDAPCAVETCLVDIEKLIDFLGNPARYLLRILNLPSLSGDKELTDEEPLAAPSGLDGYAILHNLVTAVLDNSPAPLETLLNAWQVLPPGHAGQDVSRVLCAKAHSLAENVRTLRKDSEPVFQDLSVHLPGWQISGRLTMYGEHMISWRPARCKGADVLRVWIWQLMAAACGMQTRAVHVGTDDIFMPPIPENPKAVLADLLKVYAQGQYRAVPLLPRASFEYATQRYAPGATADKALNKALAVWKGGFRQTPECEDIHIALVYREQEPDWHEFMTVTELIYGPILSTTPGASQ